MPELQQLRDIEYLREMLKLGCSDGEAENWLRKQLKSSQKDWTRLCMRFCLSDVASHAKDRHVSMHALPWFVSATLLGLPRCAGNVDNFAHNAKAILSSGGTAKLTGLLRQELNDLHSQALITGQGGYAYRLLPYGKPVEQLLVDSCKVMSSAARPLWLTFKCPSVESEEQFVRKCNAAAAAVPRAPPGEFHHADATTTVGCAKSVDRSALPLGRRPSPAMAGRALLRSGLGFAPEQ